MPIKAIAVLAFLFGIQTRKFDGEMSFGFARLECIMIQIVQIITHLKLCVVTATHNYIYVYEYCFTLLSAQSWQYRDRRKPEAGTMPYSYFEWLQGFFIVHSTIGSTVHSMPLNSMEHCICTTTMTNIRPDRDSNLVPPGYKPQSIRMSHLGRQQHTTISGYKFKIYNSAFQPLCCYVRIYTISSIF